MSKLIYNLTFYTFNIVQIYISNQRIDLLSLFLASPYFKFSLLILFIFRLILLIFLFVLLNFLLLLIVQVLLIFFIIL